MRLQELLADLVVLDLTRWWSGPLLGRNLADLGATVIKVESRRLYDAWRGNPDPPIQTHHQYPNRQPGDDPYNRHAGYRTMNRGKFSLTLELNRPEGRQAFLRLVPRADVLVENYSARVMQNLGLGYQDLREHNPRLIMLSMPALGASGPEKDYVAFGATIEWLSGVTYLNRYEEGRPFNNTGLAFGDPVAGYFGTFALAAALCRREVTGEGVHIDLSQLEAMTLSLFDVHVRYQVTGDHGWPPGHAHPTMVPHGVYPCAGHDRWVAIAVRTDEEWQALCRVMERHDLGGAAELASVPGRLAQRSDIDQALTAWTSGRSREEVVQALQAAGIPTAPVNDARDLVEDPHLWSRRFFLTPDEGLGRRYPYPGLAVRMSAGPRGSSRPAPRLGADRRHVLSAYAGLTDEEITALERAGITGEGPAPLGGG